MTVRMVRSIYLKVKGEDQIFKRT